MKKISIRVRLKDSVHFSGATLNVPESMRENEIDEHVNKYVKSNFTNVDTYFWKILDR